jgi:hypothetical protein
MLNTSDKNNRENKKIQEYLNICEQFLFLTDLVFNVNGFN